MFGMANGWRYGVSKGQTVGDDLLGALETSPSASPQPFPSLPRSLSLKTLSSCLGHTVLGALSCLEDPLVDLG